MKLDYNFFKVSNDVFSYLDLATGLRRGELLGLKWDDIDLTNGVIHVHRQVARVNGEVREVPLKTNNSYRSIAISSDAVIWQLVCGLIR